VKAPTFVLILVATSLAGCTDGTAPEDSGSVIVTDPTDFSNATFGGFHFHDYWNGADEVQVMNTTGGLQCGVCNGNGWTTEPDDGNFVPQGTASIEFIVNWSNQPQSNHPDPSLWVKTAGQEKLVHVFDLINGELFVLETTLDDADLPHQFISGWEIALVWPQGGPEDTYTIGTSFTLEMTAIRGLELVEFPPHPDHWGEQTHIDLFEGEQTLTNSRNGQTYVTGPGFRVFQPDDGVIVPWGTEFVEVILSNQGQTELELNFHAADSTEWKTAVIHEESGSGTVFRISADGLRPDGPYAKQSLWEFHADVPDDGTGTRSYSGSYSLSAVAFKMPDSD
jgi:hypothetical protein